MTSAPKIIEQFRALVAEQGPLLINLLIEAEKLYLRRAGEELDRLDAKALSNLELRVLTQLCADGVHAKHLPRRLNMSKQAVSQILASLEQDGLITRDVDPEDKRARVINFTDEGFSAVSGALRAAMTVERELATILGLDSTLTLKETLAQLIEGQKALRKQTGR